MTRAFVYIVNDDVCTVHKQFRCKHLCFILSSRKEIINRQLNSMTILCYMIYRRYNKLVFLSYKWKVDGQHLRGVCAFLFVLCLHIVDVQS